MEELAEVDRINRTPTRRFLIGALAFVVAFPALVVLHNVFAALAGDRSVIDRTFGFLSTAAFVGALGLCPAGAAWCLAGAAVTRLFSGRPAWLRRSLVILVPTTAALLAVWVVGTWNPFSVIERDPAAGFNGSFEIVRSGLPVNWYVYRRPLRDGWAELDLDSTDAVDGNRSVRFSVRAPDSGRNVRFRPGIFQVADADPAGAYDVSFWLKNEGSSVRLLITSESPQSREPRTPITKTIDPAANGPAQWRRFSYTYTVPPPYSNIRFELRVTTPGEAWIDDVRVVPASGGR